MSKEPKQNKAAAEDSFSLKEIRSLLDLLEKHDVSEFKLERGGEKIWLRRGAEEAPPPPQVAAMPQIIASAPQPMPQQAAPQQVAAPAQNSTAEAVPITGAEAVADNSKEVVSPMVGTFYRRPAVDAEPYVEVGDMVKKGDVLCIVEAMKLMNEIEAEFAGKIVEICLEDGQMVEYGEALFRVEPSA